MGLSGHDLLRDPVAAVLKGALLGLVLRELVLARPVDGVVYAVPAVSLLAWLVLLVVRGRRLRLRGRAGRSRQRESGEQEPEQGGDAAHGLQYSYSGGDPGAGIRRLHPVQSPPFPAPADDSR